MTELKRRAFLKQLAAYTGGVVVAPIAVSCGKSIPSVPTAGSLKADAMAGAEQAVMPEVPLVRPADWDPIAFNKKRGILGAIPASYHADINGLDGEKKHLGKHLPYVPGVDAALVPEGFVPLMWGDPSLGYAKHPNAPKGDPTYPKGHFYDWIQLRKATAEEAEETDSIFGNWPIPEADDNGQLTVFGDGEITADSGKNTVYLVGKPADVVSGDVVRIHGHCLYHGEYVDFITI